MGFQTSLLDCRDRLKTWRNRKLLSKVIRSLISFIRLSRVSFDCMYGILSNFTGTTVRCERLYIEALIYEMNSSTMESVDVWDNITFIPSHN